MKIFYVITHIEQFIGYTDNEYLYNLYMKQLEDWGMDDSIYLSGNHECKSEKEFLYDMGRVIRNTFRSHYLLAPDNKLISIKDYYSQNVLVLNSEICMYYEDRTMPKYTNDIIRKIGKMVHPNIILRLYKYLYDEKNQGIIPLISRLHSIIHFYKCTNDTYTTGLLNDYNGLKDFTGTVINSYKYFKDRDCIRGDTLLISIHDISIHWTMG